VPSPYAFLDDPTDAPILIDASSERVWTQAELAAEVERRASELRTGRHELVFCFCGGRDFASVIGYLAAIRAGHAVAMLDGGIARELIDALIERYRPLFVLSSQDGRTLDVRRDPDPVEAPIHEDLQVLLSTSGTTGSPKFARLSRQNILAHAEQLCEYLEIDADERALQSLPIHYSYGLSVLNTHLAARGRVILSEHSIMRPEHWAEAQTYGATSFAGVPYSYVIVERLRLTKHFPDTLRTLTQSGARLAPDVVTRLVEHMRSRGGRMFVMYGQTESTARMTYVHPDWLPQKAHCVGRPIPQGSLTIRVEDEETSEPEVEGEVVFRGPNVMMGYAEQREDLSRGDELRGVLHTGDVGIIDSDGFLRLTDRLKRFAKIYGLRVSLDEVENSVHAVSDDAGLVAAVDGGDRVVIWRMGATGLSGDDLRVALARRFNLKSSAFAVNDVDELPLTGRQKIDYRALAKLSAS